MVDVFQGLGRIRVDAPTDELTQFASLVTANQYRVPYRLTISVLPSESTVLDWGCGDGHFSYFLLRSGYRVVSYSLQHQPYVLRNLPDALSNRLAYVQGRPSEPTRLPFPDDSFDGVVSVGVLEHVRETGGTEIESLAEIRRVLRASGSFLCFHLPNRYSYIEAASRVLGRGHHSFRYSGREILRLFADAGLNVVAQGRYAFLPRNIFSRLPGKAGDSVRVALLVNRIDDQLLRLGSSISQNHYVVARRAPAATSRENESTSVSR